LPERHGQILRNDDGPCAVATERRVMEDPDRSGHPGTPGRGAFLILYLKAVAETESDIMSPTKEQERNAMKRPRASKGGFIFAKRVRNEGPSFETRTLPSKKTLPSRDS
jgi:hypothetical protein